MAKSGKPRAGVLLLAVFAVSLVAAHRVTAASVSPVLSDLSNMYKAFSDEMVDAVEWPKKVVEGASKVVEVYQEVTDKEDPSTASAAPGRGSTQIVHNDRYSIVDYVGVTAIKVGDGAALEMGSTLAINSDGSGGVLVSSNFPLTLLNIEAYQQLSTEIDEHFTGAVPAKSLLRGIVNQPCYKGGTAPPITLVFHGGDEMKVQGSECWYDQGDGSMCLAILQAPWTTGPTIIGSMLQTGTGMSVDRKADKWTFQTTTKDGSGSGTPAMSKSNTAPPTKLFLGAWVLLLPTMLAYI